MNNNSLWNANALVPPPVIVPNAQSIIAIVMLLVLAAFFIMILAMSRSARGDRRSASSSASASSGRYSAGSDDENNRLAGMWKRNKNNAFAWIGLVLTVALAIAFSFQSAIFTLSLAGQQAAMMANVVVGILLILLLLPCVAGAGDPKSATFILSLLALILAVVYVVSAGAVWNAQLQAAASKPLLAAAPR